MVDDVHVAAVPRLVDVALATLIAVIASIEILLPLPSVMGDGSRGTSLVMAWIACAALVSRRTHPLPTTVAVMVTLVAFSELASVLVLFWGQFVPIVFAVYSVARYGTRREGTVGGVTVAAGLIYFDLRVEAFSALEEILFHWMVCTLAFSLGWFVRGFEGRAHEEGRRAVLAETTSREQALQAVVEERARIARELHDIVAHSVSVMVVQAGAAQKALDDAEFVARALDSIRTTGTSALTEMRRVVALIRDDENSDATREPQPDLRSITELIASMDVPTTLTVEGEERPLEAGIALSAYRIVQEALTNVRRHAKASSVAVTLRYLPASLEIDVVDDGVGTDSASGGNGLVGMRERTQMYGGSVSTDSSPGKGFRVLAVLPMAPVTA